MNEISPEDATYPLRPIVRRCMDKGMNKNDAAYFLSGVFNIHPSWTHAVWDMISRENAAQYSQNPPQAQWLPSYYSANANRWLPLPQHQRIFDVPNPSLTNTRPLSPPPPPRPPPVVRPDIVLPDDPFDQSYSLSDPNPPVPEIVLPDDPFEQNYSHPNQQPRPPPVQVQPQNQEEPFSYFAYGPDQLEFWINEWNRWRPRPSSSSSYSELPELHRRI